MNIPILIICYNNYKYVRNTIEQIRQINEEYLDNIIIIDNCSTHEDTIEYLKTLDIKIIYNSTNNGPWVCPWCNVDIYNLMPNKFILTDADLEFNKNLSRYFIQEMVELSDKYNCGKIGFALDISEPNKLYTSKKYADNKSIYEWESQFWLNRIDDSNYELYNAEIDTTFCLINKQNFYNSKIRVAGNFTAKHLPWYIENPIYSRDEIIKYCKSVKDGISTISRVI